MTGDAQCLPEVSSTRRCFFHCLNSGDLTNRRVWNRYLNSKKRRASLLGTSGLLLAQWQPLRYDATGLTSFQLYCLEVWSRLESSLKCYTDEKLSRCLRSSVPGASNTWPLQILCSKRRPHSAGLTADIHRLFFVLARIEGRKSILKSPTLESYKLFDGSAGC